MNQRKHPFVSVVMPAYNSERFIAKSIQSVISQTYPHWELLLIDDCSADRTPELALEMAKKDGRIRYYRNEKNEGISKSRNRGVELAEGDWIAFLDSDDCWSENKLERQLKLSKIDGAEFLFSGSSFIDETGAPIKHYLAVPGSISFQELLKQNIISCSSVMIKKSIMERYPMSGVNLHEDFAVWLRILRDEKICAYGIDEPLLIYRVHPGSISGNKLKAAGMTYRVYRYIGLPIYKALYFWFIYIYRNIKKYMHIWK